MLTHYYQPPITIFPQNDGGGNDEGDDEEGGQGLINHDYGYTNFVTEKRERG